ncbi:DUF805 domain-containing protein [Avibacterium avium]|uniref:DUF805 domain-containing protein n=2 Tax=Avibacterium avium TaxID=751 RepID=UPI003BF7CE01
MTPIKAFSAPLFGFEGRINRLRYLIALPIIIIGQIVLVALAWVIAMIRLNHVRNPSSINWGIQGSEVFLLCLIVIAIVIFLIFKYSHISRRTQDFDKSILDSSLGFWVVCFDSGIIVAILIPGLIGAIIFSNILEIIILIRLAFLEGTDGDNKFGSKPKSFGKIV